MDEKLLKIFTITIAGMTALLCFGFTFFPEMHEQYALAEETRNAFIDNLDMKLINKMTQPDEVISEEKTEYGQIKIKLPEGVTENDVLVENDYLNQSIYVSLLENKNHDWQKNSISGSPEHISSLSYYTQGNNSVVAINTDLLYECDYKFSDGNLYIDFVDPHDIYDKVIVIDAGHGGRATGATRNGIEEKNINLSITMKLYDMLKNSGKNWGVYLTRSDDSNPSLAQRSNMANKAKADLFISIHNNASGNGNFSGLRGTQVLYSPSDTNEFSSFRFAEICMNNVTAALGSENAGFVKADDIYIVRTCDCPVALIEVGYMTNREELDLLATDQYQSLAAQGVVNSIQAAFDEGF